MSRFKVGDRVKIARKSEVNVDWLECMDCTLGLEGVVILVSYLSGTEMLVKFPKGISGKLSKGVAYTFYSCLYDSESLELVQTQEYGGSNEN